MSPFPFLGHQSRMETGGQLRRMDMIHPKVTLTRRIESQFSTGPLGPVYFNRGMGRRNTLPRR